jgi:hypothetical protein
MGTDFKRMLSKFTWCRESIDTDQICIHTINANPLEIYIVGEHVGIHSPNDRCSADQTRQMSCRPSLIVRLILQVRGQFHGLASTVWISFCGIGSLYPSGKPLFPGQERFNGYLVQRRSNTRKVSKGGITQPFICTRL